MTDTRQAFKVGDRIGKELTVLGVLDKGGHDPVYVVWHHGAWCYMACKVFGASRMAKREAEILLTLTHPNIVRSFGLGKPASLLTELLDGPILSRMIHSQPKKQLSVSDAVRVTIHLGAALEYAHTKGVLHLDVKPYNVIVAPGGRPVLYDFGCARLEGAPRPPLVAGTDPYIAPEECLRERVTPAADVFGLGVTLYEMLTGELPFREGTRGQRFPQTKEPPVPVRIRRASVPASLNDLVLSCLARDPDRRPTIAALLPALHHFIRRGPPMWPNGFQPAGTS
jgi:eukaryotic-like serine/threonine-protein kinase